MLSKPARKPIALTPHLQRRDEVLLQDFDAAELAQLLLAGLLLLHERAQRRNLDESRISLSRKPKRAGRARFRAKARRRTAQQNDRIARDFPVCACLHRRGTTARSSKRAIDHYRSRFGRPKVFVVKVDTRCCPIVRGQHQALRRIARSPFSDAGEIAYSFAHSPRSTLKQDGRTAHRPLPQPQSHLLG